MTTAPLPGRSPALPDPPPFTPRPRFALKPVGPPSGLFDGAWWPHSDDLAHELPLIMAELDRSWGRINRVTVDPRHWRQPLPARLPMAGRVIRIGWCAVDQDPHKLLLLSFGVGRCNLLVVPLQTDPTTAARLMAAAADPAIRQTASALLAAAVALATNTPGRPTVASSPAPPWGWGRHYPLCTRRPTARSSTSRLGSSSKGRSAKRSCGRACWPGLRRPVVGALDSKRWPRSPGSRTSRSGRAPCGSCCAGRGAVRRRGSCCRRAGLIRRQSSAGLRHRARASTRRRVPSGIRR
ncbi:DUF5994 family protein [Streptacidiphilus anmyonensis]|uniref:DUF5994 family protein n=1 Tax=Streptacidiphilus anmyonensis TaxID=405782 RepID=UPI0034E2AA8D